MSERAVYESLCTIGRRRNLEAERAKTELRRVARKHMADEDNPKLEAALNQQRTGWQDFRVELARHVAHCRDGCKRAPAAQQPPIVLDMVRAPWRALPEMPPAEQIAARLRAGEALEAVAADLSRKASTLRSRLNQAGWMATGEPVNPTAPPEPIPFRPPVPTFFSEGLCAETDPEGFFPEKGASTRPAKAVCGFCRVRSECLDFALDQGIRHGVWGGLSDRERLTLERDRKAS